MLKLVIYLKIGGSCFDNNQMERERKRIKKKRITKGLIQTCQFFLLGSGKTAAFLLPSLSGLFGRAKELAQPRPAPYEMRSFKAEPLVLVIAPTRELCSQIFDECRKVKRGLQIYLK